MKKVFTLILSACLLLVGCAGNVDPEQTEQSSVTATEPSGLYVPGSSVEKQTNGAVRRFDLAQQYSALAAIGEKLLLITQEQTLGVTELIGGECVPGKTVELPATVWQATQTGFVYYDAAENCVVFLDPQLQELKTVEIPDKLQGDPVISADGGLVFYCTEDGIRVLETEYKISRLLKSHNGNCRGLLGSYFDGKILACSFENNDGSLRTEYLSTENGQTIAANNGVLRLDTYSDSYFAVYRDGASEQLLIGIKDTDAQQLLVEGQTFSALAAGGVVACRTGESGVILDYYTAPEGKRTASVELEGFSLPVAVYADRWNNCVWVLTADGADGDHVLLRWSLKESAVEDETTYVGGLYTADAPDEEGLDACQDRVEDMNKEYGVLIRIWQTALKDTNGYDLEPEYQVGAITKALDELEELLEQFPSRFLTKSSIKRIRILIVRSINSEVTSTFYWENSDPTIILSAGTDVTNGLLKGLGYVFDSNVLGSGSSYDDWNSLNPEGFEYGNAETYAAEYLTGEKLAFLSEQAMTSAREDRSQIFCMAMQADQAECFASETMQNKLKALCQGIRSAWSLKKKTESFPWEQYLAESIAYQG